MTDIQTCIDLAKLDAKFAAADEAEKAARIIGIELSDRRGFDICSLNDGLRDEIFAKWAKIIRRMTCYGATFVPDSEGGHIKCAGKVWRPESP